MKKVIFKTKTADFKQGKFIDEDLVTVVASTKSLNNACDEVKASGKIVTQVIEKDLFLDKKEVTEVLQNYLFDTIQDTQVAEMVVNHCLKALDGACCFYRPIKR